MVTREESPPQQRTPRRDAVRNDARVVEAARAVFAEQGPQASMEAIASRAGIGVGTIYRRFAGKEALLDAIALSFMEEMERAAAAAVDDPDPGVGLERFLEFVGAFNAEKRRYAAELTERVSSDDASAKTTEYLRQLTAKAVESGYLAPGTTADDLKALIVAVRGVVASSPDGDDVAWRRFLDIHLAGLRRER